MSAQCRRNACAMLAHKSKLAHFLRVFENDNGENKINEEINNQDNDINILLK